MNPYPEHLTHDLPDGPSFEMILVRGGDFLMGNAEEDAVDFELPVHPVRLSSFYMAQYPVTQALWEAVMGENPSRFKGSDRPVERVSWEDAQQFIELLKERTGRPYRLPTEAEWEFAARGGLASEDYLYAGSDDLKEVGWYDANSEGETHAVGQLMANELGLHDMSGNVLEWCQDWYQKEYYESCFQSGRVEDPGGPETGSGRVLRGGSWDFNARNCRWSYRNYFRPGGRSSYFGFRLVLSPQSVGGLSGSPVS